jgi:hypothetical protein
LQQARLEFGGCARRGVPRAAAGGGARRILAVQHRGTHAIPRRSGNQRQNDATGRAGCCTPRAVRCIPRCARRGLHAVASWAAGSNNNSCTAAGLVACCVVRVARCILPVACGVACKLSVNTQRRTIASMECRQHCMACRRPSRVAVGCAWVAWRVLCRLYLEYHTPEQVNAGAVLGTVAALG